MIEPKVDVKQACGGERKEKERGKKRKRGEEKRFE